MFGKKKDSISDEKIVEDKNEYTVLEQDLTIDTTEKDIINYFKELKDIAIYLVVVIAIVSFIYTFVGQQVEVSGMSMQNTLQDKDHLILEKVTYRYEDPKRYDIIVFRPYNDHKDIYYIKRIIGLPGETVQIIGSSIYINGNQLDEGYGNEDILDGGVANEMITLGEEEYFVLGDNRNNSKDSRFVDIGNVNKSSIIGRTWIRIWPIHSVSLLKHQ